MTKRLLTNFSIRNVFKLHQIRCKPHEFVYSSLEVSPYIDLIIQIHLNRVPPWRE